LYFSEEERAVFDGFLKGSGVARKGYLVLEPHSKADWFGDLRAWPFDKWKELVGKLRGVLPSEIALVQVGVPGKELLPGVLDWTGLGSFRQAALALESSALFLGTEGGLMHAAAAVGAPAVILYGCVTLPEYSGYPERHRVICHYLPCAPSGARGKCSCGGESMKGISVEEVLDACRGMLEQKNLPSAHGNQSATP
jgi:ADP-heptose:LPS heptosyltransferase